MILRAAAQAVAMVVAAVEKSAAAAARAFATNISPQQLAALMLPESIRMEPVDDASPKAGLALQLSRSRVADGASVRMSGRGVCG